MEHNGQRKDKHSPAKPTVRPSNTDFVLEKGIFSNIFEKDIRRVYIYKKVERLAKAIHLVSPAFRNSPAMRDRMDRVAVGLVDAAILPPASARDALSRELLALSSVLSIARTGGLLSAMNAELIAREAQQLLQEIASYEEPRLFLDDAPSLAELSKDAVRAGSFDRSDRTLDRGIANDWSATQPQTHEGAQLAGVRPQPASLRAGQGTATEAGDTKGQVKDSMLSDKTASRREAIMAILKRNGPSYIKDVSTVIREVSEKTIQRELQALVEEGQVIRTGERRWTTYALA